MALTYFKLVFYCPPNKTKQVLNHLFSKFPQNVGKVGNYEQCAFVTKGIGQYKPEPGANPTTGTIGKLECGEEDRIETLVTDKGENQEIREVVKELKKAHPFEEPEINVYRLENI